MWDIDGVVDIVDRLGEPRSETAVPSQPVPPAPAGRKEQEEKK